MSVINEAMLPELKQVKTAGGESSAFKQLLFSIT